MYGLSCVWFDQTWKSFSEWRAADENALMASGSIVAQLVRSLDFLNRVSDPAVTFYHSSFFLRPYVIAVIHVFQGTRRDACSKWGKLLPLPRPSLSKLSLAVNTLVRLIHSLHLTTTTINKARIRLEVEVEVEVRKKVRTKNAPVCPYHRLDDGTRSTTPTPLPPPSANSQYHRLALPGRTTDALCRGTCVRP